MAKPPPPASSPAWKLFNAVGRLQVRLMRLDLDSNVKLQHSWDRVEGLIELKSKAGRRNLPLCQAAKRPLLEHLLATGRRHRPEAFVFGRRDTRPFTLDVPSRRAARAWKAANAAVKAQAKKQSLEVEADELLTPIGCTRPATPSPR